MLHGDEEVLLKVTEDQGQQNLWRHFENVHEIRQFTRDERKAAKASKAKEKSASGTVPIAQAFSFARSRPTKEQLSKAVYQLIVSEPLPFSFIESPALECFIRQLLVVCGVNEENTQLVSRKTVKDWVTRDAELARDFLRGFWESNICNRFFSLSADEKKATQQKVPMMDVILHCFLSGQGGSVSLLSIPLAVTTLADKNTDGRVRAIEGILRDYRLDWKGFMVAFTADQGDESVGNHFQRAGRAFYIPCVAHYVNNVVKRAAKASRLAKSKKLNANEEFLFEDTREIVQSVSTHYQVQQTYQEVRRLPQFLEDGKKVLALLDYTDTRFLTTLIAGYRLCLNGKILEEVGSRALRAQTGSSLSKFPTRLLPLRSMIDQWKEVFSFFLVHLFH